ncbi:MAG: carboxymuconolactone decarboxylase, partial [Nitrospira sp. WS238]|nr:carboxymuconolactone decarboxylase [Nitrospira sp. WS238]
MKFRIHTTATAPKESRRALKQIENKYGFVPNYFGVLSESPVALHAYVGVSDALQDSVLSPIERQVVALTISVTTDCAYCVADHSTLAEMAGMPDHILKELRQQKPLSDKRLNALRGLVLSIVYHRGWVPKDDLEHYARVGYSERHILEIISVLALKIMSNYVNHIAKTPLDAQFSGHAWSPKNNST